MPYTNHDLRRERDRERKRRKRQAEREERTVVDPDADRTWMMKGACMGLHPRVMFPDTQIGARLAKQICARCGVIEECANYARDYHENFGVWGGLSETQRKRRNPPAPVKQTPPPCGTEAGYHFHRKHLGEPACADCRNAHSVASQEYYQRNKVRLSKAKRQYTMRKKKRAA